MRSDPSQMPRGSMYYGHCRLLFNEISLSPAGSNQFIELKKICDREPDKQLDIRRIDKYKILVVENSGNLVGVCNLHGDGISTDGQFYFVIGGSGIEKSSMRISACHFAEDADEANHNRFPVGDRVPTAFMLVHNEKTTVLEDLDLENKGTALNPRWKKVPIRSGGKIMKYLQDMVIMTGSSPYTDCNFFKQFYSGYRPNQKTIVREWGESVIEDRSLSKCPLEEIGMLQYRPFQAETFAFAPLSPGEDNNCKTAVRFFIEDTQPKRQVPRVDFTANPGHECIVTTHDDYIDRSNMITNPLVYRIMLQLAIDEADRCNRNEETTTTDNMIAETIPPTEATSFNGEDPDSVDADMEETFIEELPFSPTVLPRETFEESFAAAGPFIIPCNEFQPQSLINELKASQAPLLDWRDLLHESTCTWFDFLGWGRSAAGYRAPRFRCKICHRLLSQRIIVDRPGSKFINKIMKSGQGIGGKCAKADNRKLIQKHVNNPLHQMAMEFVKLFETGLRGEELKAKFQERGGLYRNFLKATENLFVGVFQGVRMDVTFYKCEMLRELLLFFDVEIGHLYDNPDGCKVVALSISNTMHQHLINYLRTSMPEFSLLVDLSTDVSKLSSAAFLIQTYDQDRKLKVYLYKVVYVSDETAETIWNTFLTQIRSDGLEEFVRQQCVGFASDSGSNVLKFRDLLQQYVDHQLINTRCYAHRLENAHKKAWSKQPYLLYVDTVVNSIYRIFHQSAKKKRILQLQQYRIGDTYFEVKKYHRIRWIAGKRRALSSVLKHWKSIQGALEEIGSDMSFDVDTRNDAKSVAATLKDAKFIATLAFVVDICDAIAEMSLGLQNRGTTLIGKKKMREDVTAKLRGFKTTNGKHLQAVLDSAQPVDEGNSRFRTSVADFELRHVSYLQVELSPPEGNNINMLHLNREAYIDDLISEIAAYFPTDSMDGFDIFDPLQWPQNDDDLQLYGNTRLASMNRNMLWNFEGRSLIPEWKSLKESITKHPEFLRRRSATPEDFWSFYLSEEAGVDWPESLKTIITNILTAPASTAEVERIFSFYTSTKTVRRFRLDISSVDAIIRLKFNGEKKLKDFNAIDYIPDFLKSHARSDDESIPAKRRRHRFQGDNEDLRLDDDMDDDDDEIDDNEDEFNDDSLLEGL